MFALEKAKAEAIRITKKSEDDTEITETKKSRYNT